jgi:hypothetical protein
MLDGGHFGYSFFHKPLNTRCLYALQNRLQKPVYYMKYRQSILNINQSLSSELDLLVRAFFAFGFDGVTSGLMLAERFLLGPAVGFGCDA